MLIKIFLNFSHSVNFIKVSISLLACITSNWLKLSDRRGFNSAVLTDLLKAFDYSDHNSVAAKLNAYTA